MAWKYHSRTDTQTKYIQPQIRSTFMPFNSKLKNGLFEACCC